MSGDLLQPGDNWTDQSEHFSFKDTSVYIQLIILNMEIDSILETCLKSHQNYLLYINLAVDIMLC